MQLTLTKQLTVRSVGVFPKGTVVKLKRIAKKGKAIVFIPGGRELIVDQKILKDD